MDQGTIVFLPLDLHLMDVFIYQMYGIKMFWSQLNQVKALGNWNRLSIIDISL